MNKENHGHPESIDSDRKINSGSDTYEEELKKEIEKEFLGIRGWKNWEEYNKIQESSELDKNIRHELIDICIKKAKEDDIRILKRILRKEISKIINNSQKGSDDICKNCGKNKKEHMKRFAPYENKPYCNLWKKNKRLVFKQKKEMKE